MPSGWRAVSVTRRCTTVRARTKEWGWPSDEATPRSPLPPPPPTNSESVVASSATEARSDVSPRSSGLVRRCGANSVGATADCSRSSPSAASTRHGSTVACDSAARPTAPTAWSLAEAPPATSRLCLPREPPAEASSRVHAYAAAASEVGAEPSSLPSLPPPSPPLPSASSSMPRGWPSTPSAPDNAPPHATATTREHSCCRRTRASHHVVTLASTAV